MDTIKQKSERLAGWILRRSRNLKGYNLPKIIEDELEKQRAEDIAQAKEWLKHNAAKYAGLFTSHYEDADGREAVKVEPCIGAELYDDFVKAMTCHDE